MDFLQRNARTIIIALLAFGVVVAISAGNDNADKNNKQTDTAQVSDSQNTEEAKNTTDEKAMEADAATTDTPENNEDQVMEKEMDADTDNNTDEDTEGAADAPSETAEEDTQDADMKESEDNSQTVSATNQTNQVTRKDDNYSVNAAKGDNQTLLVRSLIDQYISENNVDLNGAQKLYAETNLVNDFGRTNSIKVGYGIDTTGADIKQRVEEARNLSAEKQTLWEAYL